MSAELGAGVTPGGGGKRKGRSKKWREILRFPHISQCDDLRKGLERDYDSLCDQQPIGRLLFRQFCERRLELLRCIRFQDAVTDYELSPDERRKEMGETIVRRFFKTESPDYVPEISPTLMTQCRENLQKSACRDLFRPGPHSALSVAPQPRAVYCKDVLDIEQFSTVKGINLDQTDNDFYAKFATGSVSIPWQNEMIETECFKDLNLFGPNGTRSPDLDWKQLPEPPKPSLLLASTLLLDPQEWPSPRSRPH
nr:G protein-coupled receptor kinase 5-like [Pelodiscus sinensis]|eukprot:XP_006134115.1 G protein-coupled receptor kinase 5-like [Pelodiscus sinensis]